MRVMIKSRLSSFTYAFSGIKMAIRTEANMKIHLFVTTLVLFAAVLFDVTRMHWMILLLCIGWVLMAEMINSSIEALCDFTTKEQHPKIKLIKDMAAGAVLISAIVASIVGLLIFLPYIQSYLKLMR